MVKQGLIPGKQISLTSENTTILGERRDTMSEFYSLDELEQILGLQTGLASEETMASRGHARVPSHGKGTQER